MAEKPVTVRHRFFFDYMTDDSIKRSAGLGFSSFPVVSTLTLTRFTPLYAAFQKM